MRNLMLLLVSVLWLSAPARADEGVWVPTGPLAAIRADATSTLLPSGKVLVAGGSGVDRESLNTAELYDPESGRWALTKPLNTPRAQHTATLLPTGEVLVVGGFFKGSALQSAELYNPTTETWTSTEAPLASRFQHTATLLPSGDVLVAGGFGQPGKALQTAELFTTIGFWSAAPFLPEARGQHTATLLPTGQVLVAGGRNGRDLVAETVLYTELETGPEWLSAGELSQPRICHTATLLPSGKVLIAGGARGSRCGSDGSPFSSANIVELYDSLAKQPKWTRSPNGMGARRALHTAVLLGSGKVLVGGGLPPSGSTKPNSLEPGSEVYDWKSDRWQPQADLHDLGGNFRVRHTATLLPSGEVLLAGGDRLRSAELYEPAPELSTRTTRIAPDGVTAPTATLLASGKVLVTGGSFKGIAIKEAWIYDPSERTWSSTKPLGVERLGHTATLLPNENVLVVGGRNKKGTPLLSSEIYDSKKVAWFPAGELAMARSGHTATLLPSGRVLIAGGTGEAGSALQSAEIYDEVGGWSTTHPMNGARSEHAAVLLATGKVLVAGGFANAPLGSAELYDPGTETWSSTGPLLIPRRQATATYLPGGRVLLAGGLSATPLAETEVYDPQNGKWAFGAKLQNARTEHEALLLPSGKVLLVGGWDGSGIPLIAVELYAPRIGSFKIGGIKEMRRSPAAVLLPSGNALLVGGKNGSGTDLNTAEILDFDPNPLTPRPVITSLCPGGIDFGRKCEIKGHFRSELEASGGGSNNAAVNYPLIQLLSLDGGQPSWLVPASQASFNDDPMTLTVTKLPPALNPGWHRLTIFTSGRAGASRLVKVGCGLKITQQPAEEQKVPLGRTATFSVEAEGGQAFQWEKKIKGPGGEEKWSQVATGRFYTLRSVKLEDAGEYRVVVSGHCSNTTSRSATLSLESGLAPTAKVLSPNGGEHWPLSTSNQINERLITWSMSDNLWICKVQVFLSYPSPEGNGEERLASFDHGDSCLLPGVMETSTIYQLPQSPPSGVIGSQYRIRVVVTNHEGLSYEEESNPFYVVQSNPDSVRTLILHNVNRMQQICLGAKETDEARKAHCEKEAGDLSVKLQELADHPRVQGLVVDLSTQPAISTALRAWNKVDSGTVSSMANQLANQLLKGIHGILRGPIPNPPLLKTYTGVKYLVLVGDDRIIPFARITDWTSLLAEDFYNEQAGLSSTTVGKALNMKQILSDDLLAFPGPIDPDDPAYTREDRIVLPDLAVGRLVEEPAEISNTISTFISRDGVLDLTDDIIEHKVLVTGYDFLLDSGVVIREHWKDTLKDTGNDESLAPVNGKLLTVWVGNSAAERAETLHTHLCGEYAVSFLNGHANHESEGVPGEKVSDIQGLEASDIYHKPCDGSTTPLNLEGGVVFAVGCHGGLPVADSSDLDNALDLPQTFLARGAVVYVANTGFGWGLLDGIGYAERLAQILSEEMSAGEVVVTGEAVKKTKLRYFLETPWINAYDEKSLLQWTFFGLPMYAVRTGIKSRANGSQAIFADLSSPRAERPPVERFGSVVVERRRLATSPESMMQLVAAEVEGGLPRYLTRLDLRFDFSADGVYIKRGASGKKLEKVGKELEKVEGCPAEEKRGCYYTLHGLVDRATGMSDQPIQPYFIYDSRLAGTSQHGVLWKGGTFVQEESWKPVMARLISNLDEDDEDDEELRSLPRHDTPKPRRRKRILGGDPTSCPVSDIEVNSLVVPTGETLDKGSIQRLFTRVDLEAFYFNNTIDPGENCDNSGPTIESPKPPGEYHSVDTDGISWHVPDKNVSDVDSGVWRVVVVYNEAGPAAEGRWTALDLTLDKGSWQGKLELQSFAGLNYVIQAVDNRGNVSWLDSVPEVLPKSGVVPEIPQVVEVEKPK